MDACKPKKKPQKPNSTVIGDNIYVLRHQPEVSERTNVQENKVVYLKKT